MVRKGNRALTLEYMAPWLIRQAFGSRKHFCHSRNHATQEATTHKVNCNAKYQRGSEEISEVGKREVSVLDIREGKEEGEVEEIRARLVV